MLPGLLIMPLGGPVPIWVAIGTAVLLLFCSLMDGWRDALIKRKPEVSWSRYHTVKWLAFYPPLILLTVYLLPPICWVGVMAGAWAVWQWGESLGGENYDSALVGWVSRLLR